MSGILVFTFYTPAYRFLLAPGLEMININLFEKIPRCLKLSELLRILQTDH